MRSLLFLLLLINLLLPQELRAGWWMLNYVPTTDTYYPETINLSFWSYGFTNSKVFGKRQTFAKTSQQEYSVAFGLPTFKLGGKWEFNMDGGVDLTQPDSKYYDEVKFNSKIRFLNDGQFGPFSPSLAFGGAYLGGRIDVDAYKHFDRKGRYHHPKAHNPALYLVASKNIPLSYLEPQFTVGYMWNNFGVGEEDIPLVGFYVNILPHKLLFLLDYYGGNFGNYGAGFFWIIKKDIWLSANYYWPQDKHYPFRHYQSESVWIGLLFNIPLKSKAK